MGWGVLVLQSFTPTDQTKEVDIQEEAAEEAQGEADSWSAIHLALPSDTEPSTVHHSQEVKLNLIYKVLICKKENISYVSE